MLFPCFPRTGPVLASAARLCAHKSCCPSTWSPGRRTPSCPACVLSSASPSAGPRSPPLSRWSAELEEISNPHLSLIKSLTETSSSLFRSGSSSLKTEKKNKLSYISCGWAPCRSRCGIIGTVQGSFKGRQPKISNGAISFEF